MGGSTSTYLRHAERTHACTARIPIFPISHAYAHAAAKSDDFEFLIAIYTYVRIRTYIYRVSGQSKRLIFLEFNVIKPATLKISPVGSLFHTCVPYGKYVVSRSKRSTYVRTYTYVRAYACRSSDFKRTGSTRISEGIRPFIAYGAVYDVR
jgi:hypothetical protein